MLGNVQGIQCIDSRVDKTDRNIVLHSTGSASSQNPISISPANANSSPASKLFLSAKSSLRFQMQARADLVDPKFKVIEWKVPYTVSTTDDNTNRCINDWMWSSLSGGDNKGDLVKSGTDLAYKCFRTVSSKTSSVQFHKEQTSGVYPFSNRQHNSSKVSVENGRNQESEVNRAEQRNLGVSSFTGDRNYSRIPSNCNEYTSRSSFQGGKGLFGMETKSSNIPEYLPSSRNDGNRSFCITTVTTSLIHCMEARPIHSGNRCNATAMDQEVSLCVPAILPNNSGTPQSSTRSNREDDSCNPNMAYSGVVSSVIRNVNRQTPSAPKTKEHSLRSFRQTTSISDKQFHETSGVENFRKTLSLSGISETASHLIAGTRRESSTSSYESAWRKWVGWCSRKQIDPFCHGVYPILNFLGELCQANYEYRTIGTHRSAISAYHDPVEGVNVRLHPKVSDLMK